MITMAPAPPNTIFNRSWRCPDCNEWIDVDENHACPNAPPIHGVPEEQSFSAALKNLERRIILLEEKFDVLKEEVLNTLELVVSELEG